jgi:peptidoglycan/LPS O-acetylase OafA/YrhL
MELNQRLGGKKTSQPNNFDSLRLIFAVLVILSHSFPLATGLGNADEPLYRLTHGQITLGNISVWAFFVISGFLITQSWQRSPKVGKYLKRRICRIYPGFVVAALLTAFAVVPIAADPSTYHAVSFRPFIFSTLRLLLFDYPRVFVHNPSPNYLNGSLWSVPYEFWCYLGVMSLGLVGLLRRRWSVVLLFALVVGLHLYMEITGWNPSGNILGQIFGYPPFWATVLPFYLAGTIFHLYGGQKLLRRLPLILAGVALVASNFIPNGLIVTMPVCGAYLLMALAYWPVLHPLNLGRFGDFSYGTYLYAFPIQQLLLMRATGPISPWLLFAEAAPITVAVGALSWFLVERHFLQRSSLLKHEGIALPEPESKLDALSSKLDELAAPSAPILQPVQCIPAKSLATAGQGTRPEARSEGEAYAAIKS